MKTSVLPNLLSPLSKKKNPKALALAPNYF